MMNKFARYLELKAAVCVASTERTSVFNEWMLKYDGELEELRKWVRDLRAENGDTEFWVLTYGTLPLTSQEQVRLRELQLERARLDRAYSNNITTIFRNPALRDRILQLWERNNPDYTELCIREQLGTP